MSPDDRQARPAPQRLDRARRPRRHRPGVDLDQLSALGLPGDVRRRLADMVIERIFTGLGTRPAPPRRGQNSIVR